MEDLSFGYWVRRRRMALDMTQAALAHQVGCAAITIKKIERDERRPSRTMATRLADCLVIPAEERPIFLRRALGENVTGALTLPTRPEAPYPASRINRKKLKNSSAKRDLFVGRERELAWLDGLLNTAQAGTGKMAFIAGSAGHGKTALMMEFIHRALETYPNLIVSGGMCTAFYGIGDPYLPFRETLGLLTGDVENHWLTKTVDHRTGLRIWQALPQILQSLAEHAPYLIEVLVPAKDLLQRAVATAPGGAGWLVQLQAEAAQRKNAAFTSEQATIFSQFSNLLVHISNSQPLLIVLDDLHWADDASLGLLFHLARQIQNQPVFILGTYRPEELAVGAGSRRHLLENILREVRRTYGNITLDLADADQSSGRQFIEAYLNALPNQLSPDFRQALYQRTAGHPLFTVEFVREMQARRDLVQDRAGRWREAQLLDWSKLPSRVEAVIAQRLGRLDSSLIQILQVASVEGEPFHAEVLARVLGVPEYAMLEQLSQQLAKRHQLVQARGDFKLTHGFLSPYNFRHALFQEYLYNQLDPGERRLLHEAVAEALVALYQDDFDTIAAQLAWHYQEAHQIQKAARFFELAGQRAIQLSGYEDALNLFQRGLACYESLQLPDRPIELKLELLLGLGEATYRSGNLAGALDIYQEAADLARSHSAPRLLARAALGYEETRWRFNYDPEPSRHLLEESLEAIDEADRYLRTRLTIGRVRTLKPAQYQEQGVSLTRQAIELARSLGDPQVLYDALYLISWGYRQPDQSRERLAASLEMKKLAESIGDIGRQQEATNNYLLDLFELGEVKAMETELAAQQKLILRVHFPVYHHVFQLSRATLAILKGDFTEAESLAGKALQTGRQMRLENADGIYGIQMFTLRREQGRLREILPLVKRFVEQNSLSAIWQPGLALIYADLDLRAEARQVFEAMAAHRFADIPQDAIWLTCIAYLAEVCAYLGDATRADELYTLLLPYTGRAVVTGFFGVCYGAVERYLGLLQSTRSVWDEAEVHFLAALALNARMEARPWLAHTQHDYAWMLRQRGNPGDWQQAEALLGAALETAHSLEMRFLIEKATKIKGE